MLKRNFYNNRTINNASFDYNTEPSALIKQLMIDESLHQTSEVQFEESNLIKRIFSYPFLVYRRFDIMLRRKGRDHIVARRTTTTNKRNSDKRSPKG